MGHYKEILLFDEDRSNPHIAVDKRSMKADHECDL